MYIELFGIFSIVALILGFLTDWKIQKGGDDSALLWTLLFMVIAWIIIGYGKFLSLIR